MKGDEEVFEAVMFAGYRGVLTGMKKGGFSISLNSRKPSYRRDIFSLIVNLFYIAAHET